MLQMNLPAVVEIYLTGVYKLYNDYIRYLVYTWKYLLLSFGLLVCFIDIDPQQHFAVIAKLYISKFLREKIIWLWIISEFYPR